METQKFKLVSDFVPTGDQPQAIDLLVSGIEKGLKNQLLLGVTGSGKTFTMANVIAEVNKPTLVIAHNKTLAMQLFLELKNLFPSNRVEYFVSNFDYYQPEAYLPSKDMYIGKDVKHNVELDMMRMSATNSLLTHRDTIVVSSVAAIYAAQDPAEYRAAFFEIRKDEVITRKQILHFLVRSGYDRNDTELSPGTFSARGDLIKIAPGYTNLAYVRLSIFNNAVESIALVDPINHHVEKKIDSVTIFPSKSYVTGEPRLKEALHRIRVELDEQLIKLKGANLLVEFNRLKQRTENDLQDLEEYGTCSGIENYSRHLGLRAEGEAPTTLLDYFGDDFLTIIDESHMTLPQVRGMYNTNFSRKQTLIKFGFRLPSALDNRPLNFDEFIKTIGTTIYTSATPGDYETSLVNKPIEQIIRPTGLVDPEVQIMPVEGQIDVIIGYIRDCSSRGERVLITALTKRMCEELADYLLKFNIKVTYIHSDLKTLERTIVINDLRRGVYDALIGVNLLREGIDIPEVSLICILGADKQGFLRDARSLIQIMGRASRNVRGRIVMFADQISASMSTAIKETERRRDIQSTYNKKNNITPTSIKKNIFSNSLQQDRLLQIKASQSKIKGFGIKTRHTASKALIKDLEREMLVASRALDFEKAAQLRDIIIELRGN